MPKRLLKNKNYDVHSITTVANGKRNANIVTWLTQTDMGGKVLAVALYKVDPTAPKKLTTDFFLVDQFQSKTTDSLRWKDVVFEATNTGSIQTVDTLFRQRYRRGYFSYTLDSLNRTIDFKKFATDTSALFTMGYSMPDTNHIVLKGKIRNDSVVVALTRQNRHLQLAERRFHWVSEANR